MEDSDAEPLATTLHHHQVQRWVSDDLVHSYYFRKRDLPVMGKKHIKLSKPTNCCIKLHRLPYCCYPLRIKSWSPRPHSRIHLPMHMHTYTERRKRGIDHTHIPVLRPNPQSADGIRAQHATHHIYVFQTDKYSKQIGYGTPSSQYPRRLRHTVHALPTSHEKTNGRRNRQQR